jgi:hypothetical protein
VDRVDLKKWFGEQDLARAQAQMHGWVEVLARTGR